MSKRVELVHTEVTTQYNSTEVLKEFNLDGGATIFTWQVKTRVNDKADKSPVIFDTCSCYADNEEKKSMIRDTIKAGAILDIKGFHDRRKASKPGPDGKYGYFDQVNVKEIIPITGMDQVDPGTQATDDDLPF